ncbi:ycf66 [Scenedesmus sp. PABB004]|nr:ycf66 [Scenedesmus sp. PABB004]
MRAVAPAGAARASVPAAVAGRSTRASMAALRRGCTPAAAAAAAPAAPLAGGRASALRRARPAGPALAPRSAALAAPAPRRGARGGGGAAALPPGAGLPPLAMINVDFASPSLVLGITLIGCGIALLQVRNMQREVSRDADIVVAAMISIVGSTLIFQGWRLDPLLLLCQALTTSVAFWYGLEAFKLRAQVNEEEEGGGMGGLPPPEGYGGQAGMGLGAGPDDAYGAPGYLPPGGAERAGLAPWATGAPQPLQQQQPQQAGGRWGLPPGEPARGYAAYWGQQAQAQPEGLYAAYDDPQQQQQQQLVGGPASGAPLPPFQQQQQQQPYGGAPGYGAPYGGGGGGAYQADGAWLGSAQDYGGGAAAAGLLQDGGYPYAPDGALPPLAPGEAPPPPLSQPQSQSQPPPLPQRRYERVDDWE